MPRYRSGSRIASGSQLIEVAIPAGPAHPPRLFDAEGLRRQRSECEVDRRALRSQGVPAHDFGARRLIDIDVGAGHTHTIHYRGLNARAAVSGYAGRRFGLTNGYPYTSLTDRDGTGHSRRRTAPVLRRKRLSGRSRGAPTRRGRRVDACGRQDDRRLRAAAGTGIRAAPAGHRRGAGIPPVARSLLHRAPGGAAIVAKHTPAYRCDQSTNGLRTKPMATYGRGIGTSA